MRGKFERRKKPKILNVRQVDADTQKYFMGELMICANCKRRQKSNPNIQSGWTVFERDGAAVYVCPECFASVFDMHRAQKP